MRRESNGGRIRLAGPPFTCEYYDRGTGQGDLELAINIALLR
jgi:hypothetical protein